MAQCDCNALYINNDNSVYLAGLYDEDSGEPITDATVIGRVFDKNDTQVGGDVTLVYEATKDEYMGVIDASVPLEDGHEYEVRVTATSGDTDGEWRMKRSAQFREVGC